MSELFRDTAYAWRNMLRQPATSLLIVFTLALGIGLNTAMFSMTWHVLLAPLPYADGDRLVKLEQHEPGNGLENIDWSPPTLMDLREQNTVFTSVLQYFHTEYTLYSTNGSFLVDSAAVDGDFFLTLGLEPELGRVFTPDDERAGAAPVMLLGKRFWTEAFGADPALVGSTVEMYGRAYEIVGVLSDIAPYPRANDVWVPAASDPVMSHPMFVGARSRADSSLISHVIARLDDGVTLEQARDYLSLFAGRLRNAYPDIYREESGYTVDLRPLKEAITGSSARTVGLLMSLAALVVLIACTNFANLTLAGVMRRSQELAVREAVGADPGTIKRQLITENVMVAGIGGLAGLALAALGLGFIADFAAIYTPLATEISLDGRVLSFCLALTLATGLASALIANLQSRDINRALKEGGDKATAATSAKKLRDGLLAAQCALAFVMLTSTALMASSLYGLVNQATGYDTEGVVVLSTVMRGTTPSTIWQERDMILQVMEEARALPGVLAVGHSGLPLLQGPGFPAMPMLLEGDGADGNRAIREPSTIVSQGFFEAMRIPLLAGRNFANTDDENAPEVVLINETFAARYFPEGNAIGRRLSMRDGRTWATIVGIVGDIRARGVDTPDSPMVYNNFRAGPTQIINLYVRTTTDLRETADAVTAIMQRLDPLQPIDSITPLEEVKDEWLAPTRLRTGLIAAFGVLALLVTLSGVIGVVSYNISQRVREIGVHMAVGANPAGIMRLFVSQGLKIHLCGLLLGLVLMIAAAPFIEPLLYETAAINAGLYLASALGLSLVVLLALYVPASKASRMQPVAALRME